MAPRPIPPLLLISGVNKYSDDPNVATLLAQRNTLAFQGTKVGVNNPYWSSQTKMHIDATTNYQASYGNAGQNPRITTEVMTDDRVHTYSTRTDGFCSCLLPFGGSSAFASDPYTNNLALTRFNNKLRSADNSVNVLVPIGELKDLKATILGAAEVGLNFLKVAQDLKKGRLKQAVRDKNQLARISKNYYKALSNAWLEYSFGIKPMVADIKNIGASIQSHLDKVGHTVELSAGARSTVTIDNGYTAGYQDQAVSLTFGCKTEHVYSALYKGAYTTKVIANNDYGAIQDHYGLHLSSLPSLAYELLAFSWVFDYFTNLGTYLEDRFTSPSGVLNWQNLGLRHDAITESYIITRQDLYNPLYNPVKSTPVAIHIKPGFINVGSYQRQRLSGFSHIALDFKHSDAIADHAINKLLNLASVLGGGKPNWNTSLVNPLSTRAKRGFLG